MFKHLNNRQKNVVITIFFIIALSLLIGVFKVTNSSFLLILEESKIELKMIEVAQLTPKCEHKYSESEAKPQQQSESMIKHNEDMIKMWDTFCLFFVYAIGAFLFVKLVMTTA